MKNSLIRYLLVFGGAVALVSCQKDVDLLDAELIQLSALDLPDEETINWESIPEEAAVPIIRTLYQEIDPKGYIKQDVIDRNGGLDNELLRSCLAIVSTTHEADFEKIHAEIQEIDQESDSNEGELEQRAINLYKWDGEGVKGKWWKRYHCYRYVNSPSGCSGAPWGKRWRKCSQIDCNVPAACR